MRMIEEHPLTSREIRLALAVDTAWAVIAAAGTPDPITQQAQWQEYNEKFKSASEAYRSAVKDE